MDTMTPKSGRFVIPEAVATHFHLRAGDTVADFGAGMGNFAVALSRLVGDEGTVYACEIQKNLVEAIEGKVRNAGLSNVETIWCDLEAENGTKLKDGVLDAGILVNTLFIMEEKEVAVKEMARTLRPGGKMFVIDWSESFGGLGPQPDQVVTAQAVKDLLEAAGLVFEREFDAGDHHYGLSFRKL